MNELSSEFNLGVTLETALQESRNQTVLLSDIRENSEARKKTDAQTFEQLKKLQQTTSQSLEVAKMQKRQSKEDSITLKTMHESTSKENAVIARRQTSTLSLLTNTVNTGLNVVNQKMFIAIESLGQSLSNVFSAVGRSIENKLYSFMGSLSVLIKPIVGIVKIGFSVMTKVLSIPLKMIWNGLKLVSKTLFGKIAILGATLVAAYYLFTKTDIGKVIATSVVNWANKKMNDPNSTIGSILRTLNYIGTALKWIMLYLGAKKIVGAVKFAKNAYTFGKSAINLARGAKPIATVATTAARPIANSVATTATTGSKLANFGSKALNLGGKFIGKGANPLGLVAGLGVDYLADKTENKTAKGWLNVGSAAISGASIGALVGGPVGAAIGGLIGGGASLLFGEGGKLLFGKNENNKENEVKQLEQMTRRQNQSQNAQIRSLDSIAESIRDTNKTMTKVIDKQNIDAQFATSRTDSFLNEQNRHADAIATNDKLDKIRDEFVKLTAAFNSLANNMSRQSNRTDSYLSVPSNIA